LTQAQPEIRDNMGVEFAIHFGDRTLTQWWEGEPHYRGDKNAVALRLAVFEALQLQQK